MLLNIALVNAEGTSNILELDMIKKSVQSKRIDTLGLGDHAISLMLYPESESGNLSKFIEKEGKFFPIFNMESLNFSFDTIANAHADELKSIFDKANSRWVLNNNLKTIEQLGPITKYLRDLWIKDRNSFFEELWFLIKSNLATTELSMIFHDLKEPTEKQAEKGEKPQLIYSYVKGEKIPQLFEGKERENVLMKEYENEFSEIFNITEYSAEKGQLIACAKIELSPILIMAKLPGLNQIQQSILVGIFNGLQ